MSGPKNEVKSLKIAGLFLDPNQFSEVPAGITLNQANNVVLDKDSILASRRGFPQYGVPPAPSLTTQIRTFFDFKDTLIIHDELGKLKYDVNGDGSVWTTYSGTYAAPGGTSSDRVVSFQSNKNLYLATNAGMYKLSSITATPRTAGVSRGLGGSGSTTGASGFMTTATNVAYRIVWGYRDENENLILGSPSDRIVVSNTSGGDRNVALNFFIPEFIDTTYFYQIYRSAGSASITTEPDDELQLIEQTAPTGAQITAGVISYVDQTPDNLRATLIYTASSLTTGGILNANTQPPFARAVCTFKNYSFFGNTRTKQTLDATLIAVGGTDGIVIGNTITFTSTGGSSFTITGAAAENGLAGQFKVTTALTPAENIDLTARSIVNVLNTVVANTIFAAYYTSGYQELPGRMSFERLTLDANTFTITSNNLTCFRPQIPSAGATYNNTSRNEALQNRVYFSKLQQPEAVPVLQYFDIGSAEEPIQALVPLRDGIIVLKTDGVFRISGATSSAFQVTPIDSTVRIIAKHSVAVLNNKVHFFSTQGIVAVSDNSAALVSRPIENTLLELSSSLYPNFNDVTFATGYESDRKYILWTVTTTGDTQGTQAFVFNTLTGDWTRWTKTGTAAIVKQNDDKLYIAGPTVGTTDQYVFQERKNFNATDYADEQYNLTVTGSVGKTLSVTSTTNMVVGYTIQQVLASARIVQIVNATTLLLDSVEQWSLGAAIAYRPIYQYFESNLIDAGDPGMMKHWADCSGIFRTTSFETIDVGFTSDTTNNTKTITLVPPTGTGGWGTEPWGTTPWGVSLPVRARLRMSVPKEAQRSNWISISMTLNQAFTDLSLAGITLTFSGMSSRMKGASKV